MVTVLLLAPRSRRQVPARSLRQLRSVPQRCFRKSILIIVATAIPADDGGPTAMVVLEVGAPPRDEIAATVVGGSAGLFEAMGAPLLRGREFTRMPAHEVVSLGISHVPEGRRLFPRLTVADNLRMGAFPRAARARCDERLKEVYRLFPRMEERSQQLAGTMSGGEQQMCAIGRALMSGPKLLLLDEPSAGLAPVMVQTMFELVRQIRQAGYTVLIVEQNIRQVLKVVDRAHLLEAGQLRRSGTAAELLESDEVRQVYLGIT